MKRGIAIDMIILIILTLIGIFILSDILYNTFYSKNKEYFCEEAVLSGNYIPSCKKYFPEEQDISLINSSYENEIEEIVGYAMNCYYKNVQTTNNFVICYVIQLNPSYNIDENEIINYIIENTTFNPNLINISASEIVGTKDLFIIYNYSEILIVQ